MPRFRKKPVVVEAEQWTRAEDGPSSFNYDAPLKVDAGAWSLWVEKSGAWCALEVGDWIIRESDGRGFYPCKPDIFAATYEPVADGP